MRDRRCLATVIGLITLGAAARTAPAQPVPAPSLIPADALVPVEDPGPRDRHWGRMMVEAALVVTGMEVQYWYNKELNQFDFEYNADWRNVRARFITLSAWSLDDNYYETNAWRHSVQGAFNYGFARSNGFSSVESYFVSLASSGAWELFGEYKEEVSINDIIVTPRSGSVIGESFWQLGTFFLRGRANAFNQVAGNLFSGGKGVLDRWDGKRRRPGHVGALGFDDSVYHRFDTFAFGGFQDAPGGRQGLFRLGAETELIMIPGYARPGRSVRFYPDPVYSRMRVSWMTGELRFIDYDVFAQTAVSAWHRKHIDAGGDGYSLLYGLSGAYRYGNHRSAGRNSRATQDRIAVAHILGPTVDLTVHHAGLDLRGVVDLYGDFAFVRNFAMDAHRAAHPEDQVRSTILRDNYYHALGVTGAVRLSASYDGFAIGFEHQSDRFRSVQGIDRHQDELIDDYSMFDARDEGRVWGRGQLGLGRGMSAELELGLEWRYRSGEVKTTAQGEHERRYVAGLRFAI